MDKRLTFNNDIKTNIDNFLNDRITGMTFINEDRMSWLSRLSSMFSICFSDFEVNGSLLKEKLNRPEIFKDLKVECRLLEHKKFDLSVGLSLSKEYYDFDEPLEFVEYIIKDIEEDIEMIEKRLLNLVKLESTIEKDVYFDDFKIIEIKEDKTQVLFKYSMRFSNEECFLNELRFFAVKEVLKDFFHREKGFDVPSEKLHYLPKEIVQFYRTLGVLNYAETISYFNKNMIVLPERLDFLLNLNNLKDLTDLEELFYIQNKY